MTDPDPAVTATFTLGALTIPDVVLVAGGIVLGLVVLAGLLAGLTGSRGPRDDQHRERDRSPVWAGPGDVRPLLVTGPEPGRLLIGRLGTHWVANEARRSLAVIAPTGSGKTPRVIVPTVLRHTGPAVVGSVKADVLWLTIAHRRERGPVWVFDPTAASGMPTARWSPLTAISTYADALRAAAWLAESQSVESRGVENAHLWDEQGRKLLAPLLFAAAATGRHMADVSRWVDYRDERGVTQILAELDDPDAQAAWAGIKALEDRPKQSVFMTADYILSSFGHPDVHAALAPTATDADDTINPARVLDTGGTVYLVAPTNDHKLYRPIFETLTNQLLREVERRSAASNGLPLHPPLLVALDEAGNIAPLRNLDEVASSGANQGISLVTAWQNESQINVLYGDQRARTVLSNHSTTLYLPGITDGQTLRTLSETIGDHQVTRSTRTSGRDGHRSHSTQTIDQRVAPPAWLRQLPAHEAIAITGRFKPMRVTVPGWFDTPQLRELVDAQVAAAFDEQFAPTRQRGSRRPRLLDTRR